MTKDKDTHIKKELTTSQAKDVSQKARQFLMQRIKDIEIIENRKLNVEPILLDELEYYIVRTWLMDKEQLTFDLFYLKMRVDENDND